MLLGLLAGLEGDANLTLGLLGANDAQVHCVNSVKLKWKSADSARASYSIDLVIIAVDDFEN